MENCPSYSPKRTPICVVMVVFVGHSSLVSAAAIIVHHPQTSARLTVMTSDSMWVKKLMAVTSANKLKLLSRAIIDSIFSAQIPYFRKLHTA